MKSWLSGLMLLVIASCGSVHVGNGMKSYQSPHGFTVTYSDKLDLDVNSDGKGVSIDNSALAKQATPDLVSRIQMQVDDDKIADLNALKALASREHRNRSFEQRNGAGLTTLVAKDGDPTLGQAYSAVYYFLLANGTLIRAEAIAVSEFRGLELIPPVLDTVTATP
jgi:hypothetical protein